MSTNYIHMNSLLFILISTYVITVSCHPITNDPQDHVVITSSDGHKFYVNLPVAMQSETIRKTLVVEGFSDEMVILFPNITGRVMGKVLEYCKNHVYYSGPGSNITAVDEMKVFDAKFLDVHYQTLFELFLAANDLKIKTLSDLEGGRIGDMMRGKTIEEIRKMFNINEERPCVDHRAEDHRAEEELVWDNDWAFE